MFTSSSLSKKQKGNLRKGRPSAPACSIQKQKAVDEPSSTACFSGHAFLQRMVYKTTAQKIFPYQTLYLSFDEEKALRLCIQLCTMLHRSQLYRAKSSGYLICSNTMHTYSHPVLSVYSPISKMSTGESTRSLHRRLCFATSTTPWVVIRISGITGRDINESVMKGSIPSFTPSW